MNHAGEITPLTAHGAAACRHHHHRRRGAYRESSRSSRRSPTPRRNSSPASSPAASPSVRATTRITSACAAAAKASQAGHVASFGEHDKAEARLVARSTRMPIIRSSRPTFAGADRTYRLGAPGRHLALNSLSRPARRKSVRRRSRRRRWRAGVFRSAAAGAAKRLTLAAADGPYALIDESYNANPASMRAAFELVGALPPGPQAGASPCLATCWSLVRGAPDDARGARRRSRRQPLRSRLRRRPADAAPVRGPAGGDAGRLARQRRRCSSRSSRKRSGPATLSSSKDRTAAK